MPVFNLPRKSRFLYQSICSHFWWVKVRCRMSEWNVVKLNDWEAEFQPSKLFYWKMFDIWELKNFYAFRFLIHLRKVEIEKKFVDLRSKLLPNLSNVVLETDIVPNDWQADWQLEKKLGNIFTFCLRFQICENVCLESCYHEFAMSKIILWSWDSIHGSGINMDQNPTQHSKLPRMNEYSHFWDVSTGFFLWWPVAGLEL